LAIKHIRTNHLSINNQGCALVEDQNIKRQQKQQTQRSQQTQLQMYVFQSHQPPYVV
jgi:hypothetical protein